MKFIVSDDFWVLDALSPGEWHLVAELPTIASGESASPTSRERLFPSPLAPDELADEETLAQQSDWVEFVQPGMSELFSEARDTVVEDLTRVTALEPQEVIPPEQLKELGDNVPVFRRVAIPVENADAWYSTLNQARILLNEEHDLANAEERLGPIEDIEEDRFVLLTMYELYSMLQTLLIEKLMDDHS